MKLINMYYFIFIVFTLYGVFSPYLYSQNEYPLPPSGYDSYKNEIPHGSVTSITYHSKTVGVNRQAKVYLPPGYTETQKYNVLYLLHGIGGDENEWLNYGQPKNILDNLFSEQKLAPMIVILPNGRAMENDDPVGDPFDPEKVQAFETFEFDLLNDLIPFIDTTFSVLTGKENRAMAGLSMGGGQSLNFGLAHLDTFTWIGSFSAAPNTKAMSQLVPNPDTTAKYLSQLWISCGTADDLLFISQQAHNYLDQNEVPHIYCLIEDAGHDWTVWKHGLYYFSQLIFKKPTTNIEQVEIPVSFKLSQNYPNPFNLVTKINYCIPQTSLVKIKVFDELGREIETLVQAQMSAGHHVSTFDCSSLVSGVYIYRLKAGNFVDTKKLILLK